MGAACGRSPLVAGAGTAGATGTASTGGATAGPSTGAASTGGVRFDFGVEDVGCAFVGCDPDLPGVEDLPAPSCRDALGCLVDCLAQGDLTCAGNCAAGLPPEEGQALLDLLGCATAVCFSDGDCTFPNLDAACFMCIGIKLVAPEPTGCEAEAAACT